jgi:hypothetical protein
MPTLDKWMRCDEDRVTLRCHSSRMPDQQLTEDIIEAVQLARRMISAAQVQIPFVIEESKKKDFKKPEYTGMYPAAVQAAKYHLAAAEWHRQERDNVSTVIKKTAFGLNADVILSDVLSYSTVDLYKVYRDKKTIDEARFSPPGGFRELTRKDPEGKLVEAEGYVRYKRKEREAGKAPPPLKDPEKGNISDIYGSMHIEFALAELYPRPQLARVIVHEATHKFANTADVFYCEGQRGYEQAGAFDMTHNADCYTYAVLSIFYSRLIKSKAECFGVFPQYGPSELEHAADSALHGRGHTGAGSH